MDDNKKTTLILAKLPEALEAMLAQLGLSRVEFLSLMDGELGYNEPVDVTSKKKNCSEQLLGDVIRRSVMNDKAKIEDLRAFVERLQKETPQSLEQMKAKWGVAKQKAVVLEPLTVVNDWVTKLNQRAYKVRFNELMERLYRQKLVVASPEKWWVEGFAYPLSKQWSSCVACGLLSEALGRLKEGKIVRVPAQLSQRAFEQKPSEQALVVKLGLHRVMGEAMLPAQLACLGLSEDTQKRIVMGA